MVLALLVKSDVHHQLARTWYRDLDDKNFGLCLLVSLPVLRLLVTRRVMGEETMPVSAGWRVLAELSEDSRVVYVAEDLETERQLPAMWRYSQLTPQLVNDGCLVALALSSGRRLVTFDKGFRELPGLTVIVLV